MIEAKRVHRNCTKAFKTFEIIPCLEYNKSYGGYTMDCLTANEIAEKQDISGRRIRILCNEGRAEGAVRKAGIWLIPENAEKPEKYQRGRKKSIYGADR